MDARKDNTIIKVPSSGRKKYNQANPFLTRQPGEESKLSRKRETVVGKEGGRGERS